MVLSINIKEIKEEDYLLYFSFFENFTHSTISCYLDSASPPPAPSVSPHSVSNSWLFLIIYS